MAESGARLADRLKSGNMIESLLSSYFAPR